MCVLCFTICSLYSSLVSGILPLTSGGFSLVFYALKFAWQDDWRVISRSIRFLIPLFSLYFTFLHRYGALIPLFQLFFLILYSISLIKGMRISFVTHTMGI